MQQIRPVRIGLILGLLGLLFGLSWIVYITAGHEAIHDTLRAGQAAAVVEPEGMAANEEHHAGGHANGNGEAHEDGHGTAYEGEASEGEGAEEHAHDDSVMEEAHEMLVKGHVHAMGLGLVTLATSLVLALACAPAWIKTVGSVCVGAGGLLYPLSWITMGYKLPSLGMEAAEKAVMPIVGISVLLVLAGLVITICCLAAGFFCRESS